MNTLRKKSIRVLIIDDHPILRRGLSLVINQEEDMTVCGEAENAQSAIRAIESRDPDIALVDISLKGINGIELIKMIRNQSTLPLLVLSRHSETIYAERAIRAGANGYIMKQEPTERVIDAIRKVMRGERYLSEPIAKYILDKRFDLSQKEPISLVEIFSDRELQVFQLIGQGLQPRQIANELNLSVKTIETYRSNIKQKLNLQSAADLIQYAIEWQRTENTE